MQKTAPAFYTVTMSIWATVYFISVLVINPIQIAARNDFVQLSFLSGLKVSSHSTHMECVRCAPAMHVM
jgi:hypothetical protein